MTSNWIQLTIGQLVESGEAIVQTGPFGSQLHSYDYVDDGVPVIPTEAIGRGRITDVKVPCISPEKAQELQRHILQPGDILFARRGAQATGLSAIVDARYSGAICGTGALLLRTKSQRLLPDFLAHFLASDASYDWLRTHAVGAVMPNINTDIIRALPVLVPPIATQSDIAAFLSAIESRITLLRETNATLEAIAQALFKSWFVDFDPVRAKQEGRAPEGMDEATAALFPDSFEDSEMGEVPRGWAFSPLKSQVEGVYDGPHATPPESTEGPVFLGIKNLTGARLDLGEVRHIAEADWKQWTKRVTPVAGDIVFSYEATLGFFALIPAGLRCCLGRRLALVRPNEVDGTPHFWLHQFTATPFQRLLDKHTIHGATVNRLALKSFPDLPVLVPSIELRRAFDDATGPIWSAIHNNDSRAQMLASIRDTLLPRLISGQLRLPEAADAIEETLA